MAAMWRRPSAMAHTQAESLEELRKNVLDAVDCYFDDPADAPTVIHLRVISEEVLVR